MTSPTRAPRVSADTPPARSAPRGGPRPSTVGFYLVPDFPMLAFAAAIEPLRAANRLSGEKLFAWQLFSHDGDPVRASNGIDVAVGGSVGDDAALDLLLVCAGKADAGARDKALAQWLR